MAGRTRALEALERLGIPHAVTRHGPVKSLEEAAAGATTTSSTWSPEIENSPSRSSGALLGINRITMPDAATALDVTGYARGTITPFGSTHPWPIIADAAIVERTISMGGGAPDLGVTVSADDVIAALSATVADVSDT